MDMARADNFISNFEPLTRSKAKEMVERSIELSEYTEPMRAMIIGAEQDEYFRYFVASSHPRIVDGKPSQNPRYQQMDLNYAKPLERYLADLGPRLYRGIPGSEPIHHPVGAILPGRRNNPPQPDAGIRPLAVFNPIHYQELPELFMDFICSLTGKSPSTTGAGSEGALTKGPFNALSPTTDLNNALLSFILGDYHSFSSAAGSIGHKYQVAHDISLLIPELWARLTPEERTPAYLIANGYLEQLKDFEYKGKTVPAGRLGWRITPLFATHFLGRIFDAPSAVFPEEMLKPELQSMEYFVDGIYNIAEAQERVAKNYLADGSVESAIPPLRAILYIMAEGSYNGMKLDDPELRKLFTRDYVLASDWYADRLNRYVAYAADHLESGVKALENFLSDPEGRESKELARATQDLKQARDKLLLVRSPAYREGLVGTIGKDILFRQ